LLALAFGTVVILLTSQMPLQAFAAFFLKPFSATFFVGNWLAGATPLIITGLAACVAFTAGAFNLGLEGQVYGGAVLAGFLVLQMSHLPGWLGMWLALPAVFIAGGALAGLSGWMRVKWKVDSLLSTFLIGNILVFVCDFLLEGPMLDPSSGLSASGLIPDPAKFWQLSPPSLLHAGIFLSIFLAIVLAWMLKGSTFGYEIRLVGKNVGFSRYGGIPVKRVYFLAFFLSGGLAALAGAVDVLGAQERVIRGFSSGYGWNGIAVALIARNHPLLVIPAALFFAYLEAGAQTGGLFADLSPEIARLIQSVVFFIVSAQALSDYFSRKRVSGKRGVLHG